MGRDEGFRLMLTVSEISSLTLLCRACKIMKKAIQTCSAPSFPAPSPHQAVSGMKGPGQDLIWGGHSRGGDVDAVIGIKFASAEWSGCRNRTIAENCGFLSGRVVF